METILLTEEEMRIRVKLLELAVQMNPSRHFASVVLTYKQFCTLLGIELTDEELQTNL